MKNVHQIESKKTEFAFELKCLLAAVEERAKEQFEYNLETNLPANIVGIDEVVNNALTRGIVGGAAYLHQWDTIQTVAIATDILEDSNCHSEVRAMNSGSALAALEAKNAALSKALKDAVSSLEWTLSVMRDIPDGSTFRENLAKAQALLDS